MLKTLDDYKAFLTQINIIQDQERNLILREMCRKDLFFLLWFGLGRKDAGRQWIIDRCQEVQASPDGHLDLWSREHYKSTIITFALTIQDILASHGDNPLAIWKGIEPTIGIFSCTRPLAKGFLRQIKREFETNVILKSLFPDVLWQNPDKDAPKWSEDDGLVVIRKSNPKESTIEAWGLIDGQPTGKHFFTRIYDDMVTIDNCRSPHMLAKTSESWELSINLGTDGGKERYIGTRYNFNDTYRVIMDRNAAIPRIYPATVDGTMTGEPVLLSRESLEKKRDVMGIYTFSSQMLLNPIVDERQGFKDEWLSFYDSSDGVGMNKYILVDPANEKKKTSDYTVMAVIGLSGDNNYYLLDMIRDRFNLSERANALFALHRRWKPLNTGYEQYGIQADISYLQEKMARENYHFPITKLGGKLSKIDRIKKLVPVFEQNRFLLPQSLLYTDYENKSKDLVNVFINEEFKVFPVSLHDDMLDAVARILEDDLGKAWPSIEDVKPDRYRYQQPTNYSAWGA